jgi:copper transport protein
MLIRRALLMLAAALVLAAVVASPASAHAILRGTSPGDGEALATAPETVSLEFNEPVETGAGGLRVFNDEGVRVDEADATAAAETDSVSVSLQPDLPEGTYVVSWRALSADAHPVHGAFVFTVGEGEADDSVISSILEGTSDSGMQIAAAVLRFLQYAAGLVAAGAAFFMIWIHDRRAEDRPALLRAANVAVWVAMAATVVAFAVQAALVTGLGLGSALDPVALGDVLASSFGVSTVATLLGLVVLAVGLRRLWDDWAVVTASVGAVMVVGSFALTGHTASTQPRWLVMTADVVHTTAAAAWFGGLVLLLITLRRRKLGDDAVGGSRLVSRFSTMATGAIVAVSLAGFALGWAEVRAPRALFSTAYGWTLVAKVAIVAVILVVGGYNQRRLVPAIQRAGADAWRQLQRTVRFEVAGLVVLIGVTAVLVNLIPARDAAGITGPLSVRHTIGEDYLIDLTVDPNRVGSNEIHIYLFSADGRAAAAEEVLVGLTLPAEEIGPIEREPTPTGPGHWTLSAAELPIAGRWIVTITGSVDRFDEITAEIPIDVGA